MPGNYTNLVNDLFGAWNAHDIERTVALYSPLYTGVDISQSEPHSGQDGIRRSIQIYLQAFPDFQLHTEEIIGQDDRVVVLWSAEGTHRGKLMNIPATALYLWDVAALLREIGLLPELAPVS